MKSDPLDQALLGPLNHRIWLATFRVSVLLLVGCLLPIVTLPHVALPSWFYWLAAGLALLCVVSAVLLKKHEQSETADDAAWLIARRERGAKNPLDLDADD
jgi:hypothetical protein